MSFSRYIETDLCMVPMSNLLILRQKNLNVKSGSVFVRSMKVYYNFWSIVSCLNCLTAGLNYYIEVFIKIHVNTFSIFNFFVYCFSP